jgi:PPIC-type PPIASE domain
VKKILQEPLLHFLFLGAAIFAVYSFVSKPASDEPGKIVITSGEEASMVVGFTRTWQRPPTREEMDGLIRDRVREEVYCREAIALGLDKDDMVIRRRLQQKMEFVTDDVVGQAQPNDEQLIAYLKAHASTFRVQRRYTFSHVYLNPEQRGENLSRDAAQMLAQLRQIGGKVDVEAMGDSFLLEHTFAAMPDSEVRKQFGEKFAAKLDELTPGIWEGPIESGYGVHLVLVSDRSEGRMPELAEVRDSVSREWANARRFEANEKYFQDLLKHYTVSVEAPNQVAVKSVAAIGVK